MLQASVSKRTAEADWIGVLKQHCADLEVGLAQEHQNRVCQEREKVCHVAAVQHLTKPLMHAHLQDALQMRIYCVCSGAVAYQKYECIVCI